MIVTMKERITKKGEVYYIPIPKWIIDSKYFGMGENVVVKLSKLADSRTIRKKEVIIEM